ncbi:MAG: GTP cyclohydrolase II [Nannocystaceae bacterium]
MRSILPVLRIHARATLPTRRGMFEVISFRDTEGHTVDDVALVRGNVSDAGTVATRIHSECLTGDALGSLRCDCREQLELALDRFAAPDGGVLLYLRQEGRGIGIAEKVRAYELQDHGMDTVEANHHLGFDDDLRSYERAAQMLHALDVTAVDLHTNNPAKVEGLQGHGIRVKRRVPIVATSRVESQTYLATKRDKMGHLLDDVISGDDPD